MVSHVMFLRDEGFIPAREPDCQAIQFIAGGIVPQKKTSAQRIVFDEFSERGGTR
jgi:hypothetical protein